jgi:hypothetical protein
MNNRFAFPRPELALHLCDGLEGVHPLDNYRDGLFLAAPRRTGKTFFIRKEMMPEMRRRGWQPVYVDLWEARETDPGRLIRSAIQVAMRERRSAVAQFIETNLDGMSLGAFLKLDFKTDSSDGAPTITQMLNVLHKATGNKVSLILDEAQQAIMHRRGNDVMAGVKAAREQINNAGANTNLILVFTGSNRDKLTQMVQSHSQPFFGSRIEAFPLLGDAYVNAYTIWVNDLIKKQFNPSAMSDAFEIVGRRPRDLEAAVKDTVFSQGDDDAIDERLVEAARVFREQRFAAYDRLHDGLRPLARVLLDRLISEGESLSPFSEPNRRQYAEEIGDSTPVTTTRVQHALEELSANEIIWNPRRGVYVLEEDASVKAWCERNKKLSVGNKQPRRAGPSLDA